MAWALSSIKTQEIALVHVVDFRNAAEISNALSRNLHKGPSMFWRFLDQETL